MDTTKWPGKCLVLQFSICFVLLFILLPHVTTFVSATSSATGGSDFYELLGVSRDADNRTIRRAFIKLAVQLHPDKNKDDPEAHEKFVRVNRAYEVLKDEELRKKYDLYGESGLNENANQPQYQSWQFYKEQFGLYDDTPEVNTLNAGDFELLVLNSGRRWFVNFYSPHCSHCHELVPVWKKLAQQLDGIVSIGAVNCMEEFHLCQQQQIGYYPSLLLYPGRKDYSGSRTAEGLLDGVIAWLDASVTEITEKSFKDFSPINRPWLIDLCHESSDCLSLLGLKQLAAALDGAVNVGFVNCESSEKLCEKLGKRGLFYYLSELNADTAVRIESLEAKEIVSMVLQRLPDLKELNEDEMMELSQEFRLKDSNSPWLVHFTSKSAADESSYKLMFSMLRDTEVQIGRFNCSKYSSACDQIHVQKFPTFILFKPGRGFEVHYGKNNLHDVVTFAKECSTTNVRTLDVTAFNDAISKSATDGAWLIDFFAPWCPPCMRLLPEFRKAAKLMDNINFGTVDCTVNNQACLSANVHSYPTTILFNGSKSDAFVGLHNVQELVNFVEDIKNPTVISLTPEAFYENVLKRDAEEIWLVDFYNPQCVPCQQLAPEIRKLSKLFKDHKNIRIADIDCLKYGEFCQSQYLHGLPTIRAYPRDNQQAIDHNSWFRDSMSLRAWLFGFLPSRVVDLTADGFYSILDSEEPWIVDFFAPWCGHCQAFAPELEVVAEQLEGKVRVGKINCDFHMHACQSALVQAYPSVRLYEGVGQNGDSQSPFGYEIHSQKSVEIIKIAKQVIRDSPKKVSRDEL